MGLSEMLIGRQFQLHNVQLTSLFFSKTVFLSLRTFKMCGFKLPEFLSQPRILKALRFRNLTLKYDGGHLYK